MQRKTKRNSIMAIICACIMAVAMVSPAFSAKESRALEKKGSASLVQAVDHGVTYTYIERKEYQNCVEIVGINAPNGPSVLKIPERLNGKTVISIYLDLFDYDLDPVKPDQDEAAVPIKKLILPKSIRPLNDKGKPAKGEWSRLVSLTTPGVLRKLESIETVPDSKYVKAKDGVLYSRDMKDMIIYPQQKKTEIYKMPSSVTWSAPIYENPYVKKIIFSKNKKYDGPYAEDCDNLESVYFPDNITKIGSWAFRGCIGLKNIRWSKNLKTIGDNAFQNCNALTKVSLPKKMKKVNSCVFRWCKNLKEVTLPESIACVESEGFGKTKADLASGHPKVKYKKAPYLISAKNKKIVSGVANFRYCKFIAVAKVTKNKKTKYYDSRMVAKLKLSTKKTVLRRGKTKKLIISPQIQDYTRTREGGKLNPEILKFSSSNPKVAMVSAKGFVKAKKRGTATITVQMKTKSVKCKVKVTVK